MQRRGGEVGEWPNEKEGEEAVPRGRVVEGGSFTQRRAPSVKETEEGLLVRKAARSNRDRTPAEWAIDSLDEVVELLPGLVIAWWLFMTVFFVSGVARGQVLFLRILLMSGSWWGAVLTLLAYRTSPSKTLRRDSKSHEEDDNSDYSSPSFSRCTAMRREGSRRVLCYCLVLVGCVSAMVPAWYLPVLIVWILMTRVVVLWLKRRGSYNTVNVLLFLCGVALLCVIVSATVGAAGLRDALFILLIRNMKVIRGPCVVSETGLRSGRIEHLMPKSIAVISFHVGNEERSWPKLAMENKRAYAERHNYTFYDMSVRVRRMRSLDRVYGAESVSWYKPVIIAEAMEWGAHKWILYMDSDAIIMNIDTPIEPLIEAAGDANFILSKDFNGFNNGVFLVRNNEYGHSLMQAWKESYQHVKVFHVGKEKARSDQRALTQLLESPRFGGSNLDVPPQCALNSYAKALLDVDILFVDRFEAYYMKGDFVVHFAGFHENVKADLIEQFLSGWIYGGIMVPER